jgi:hypothetical protein
MLYGGRIILYSTWVWAFPRKAPSLSPSDRASGGEGRRKGRTARPQRKLFSYLLRHQEWNWDYRFLIVRTPRWYETR